MRQRYFHSGTSKLIFVLDVVAVMVSLTIAVAVRSHLGDYLFAFSTAIAVFSLTQFLRLLNLFLFDAYTVSFATFTNGDMQRIMRLNLLPSAVLLILRLASPVVSLRMPISMIVIEYIGTTLGFIMIRTVMQRRLMTRSTDVGHKERILLWGEVADIRELIPDVPDFCRRNYVEIMGILNSNPLFWQTEYEGIRVYGDETKLRDLLLADDRIAAVCFLCPQELQRSRIKSISSVAEKLNLRASVIENDRVKETGAVELSRMANDETVVRRKGSL